MQLALTATAQAKLQNMLSKQPEMKAFRLAVDGGGCSGFQYKYNLTDEITSDDEIINFGELKVVIDTISQAFLSSSHIEIDYITELGQAYFQINNSKAKAKCGCGNSFAI